MIVNHSEAYEVWPCPECSMMFAVPAKFADERRKDGRDIWCPNGHSMSYKSENEKIRRERDTLKQEQARLTQIIAEERKKRFAAEDAAASAKAATTRLKKRAAAGTCPCCKRSFSNMAVHMKKQHPAFVAENVVSIGAKA